MDDTSEKEEEQGEQEEGEQVVQHPRGLSAIPFPVTEDEKSDRREGNEMSGGFRKWR